MDGARLEVRFFLDLFATHVGSAVGLSMKRVLGERVVVSVDN